MKILFLYSEIAEYFMSCVRALAAKPNMEILLVRWKVNAEAPFQFQFPKELKLLTKGENSLAEISAECQAFNPDIVYTTGWIDKDYLQIAKKLRKNNPNLPVIAGLDNPLHDDLKKRLFSGIYGIYLRQFFTHIWAAGIRQYEFARRLGFAREKILLGLYSADVKSFQKENYDIPRKNPKVILHVGRFLDWKGVEELYQAFNELQQENQNDWQLWMIGNGPLKDKLSPTQNIEIKEFMQPKEVASLMKEVGCFVLASWDEHWGVVVHEAATAGCVMLVSDGVSAGGAFVRHGYNGYVFASKNKNAIKSALTQVMQKTPNELQEMGKRSVELARQITPEIWVETLLSVKS